MRPGESVNGASGAEPALRRLVTFPGRSLMRYLSLTRDDLTNLSVLYLATLVMRAAAFAGIAVMEHVVALDPFWYGVLFTVYPLAEILSVGYFGTLCDRYGRKGILVAAHVVTGAAVFLFILAISPAAPSGLVPYFVGALFVLFGLGAAMKVASTLAMVNDHTSVGNRAQLMAVFDLVTFGGFALGFGAGFLALLSFGWTADRVLLVGGIGVLISVAMVLFFVRETQGVKNPHARTWTLLRTVFRDRDILHLLPVYIPVVALYGYVIAFTEQLIVPSGTSGAPAASGAPVITGDLVAVVLSFVVPLVVSMVLLSRYSDIRRLRRPFMGAGLLCFGGLAILLSMAQLSGGGADLGRLYGQWPLIAALSFGAGAFPPAALAYLGDIVHRDVSGTSFGVYSIIFGSGLIVGPALGGALTAALGNLAFILIALTLIGISGVAVLFLREPAAPVRPARRTSAAPDPPGREP